MAENKRDYYEVLGVSKGASEEEIKKAYKKLAQQVPPRHEPRRQGSRGEVQGGQRGLRGALRSRQEGALRPVRLCRRGPQAMARGAGGGAYGAGGFDFGDLGDIFGSFFGGGFGGTRANPNAPQRGESLRTSVTISFEEAAFGCEKEISIERDRAVRHLPRHRLRKGHDRRGLSRLPRHRPWCSSAARRRSGFMSTSAPCGRCGGKGRIIHQPCKACRRQRPAPPPQDAQGHHPRGH